MVELPRILRGVLRRQAAVPPGAAAIEAALRARTVRPSERAAMRRARLVFHAGETGVWSVDLRDGRATISPGRPARGDVTITSDALTLAAVLEGRLDGVQAFLDGRLFMRGNIALALELDDLLPPPARDARAPRCHRVTAEGVKSFYLEAGARGAPPVVLIHGLGATSASFLPTFVDLARDHHVLAVDLPGFGESGKPLRPLHPEFFARWLVAFLDAVAIERAHLVGNSMGGRVALEVGIRSPSRVGKLVLLAPSMAWRRYRAAAGIVRLLRARDEPVLVAEDEERRARERRQAVPEAARAVGVLEVDLARRVEERDAPARRAEDAHELVGGGVHGRVRNARGVREDRAQRDDDHAVQHRERHGADLGARTSATCAAPSRTPAGRSSTTAATSRSSRCPSARTRSSATSSRVPSR